MNQHQITIDAAAQKMHLSAEKRLLLRERGMFCVHVVTITDLLRTRD